jgi:hypothetical protein
MTSRPEGEPPAIGVHTVDVADETECGLSCVDMHVTGFSLDVA